MLLTRRAINPALHFINADGYPKSPVQFRECCNPNKPIEVITTIKRNTVLLPLLILISFLIGAFTINQEPSLSTTLEKTKSSSIDTTGREVVITSYNNQAGKVTVATDKGYASVRKTYEDGKVVLKEYLDGFGEPILLSSGYAAIELEYEDGLNTIITYIGLDHQPIVIKNGYSTIHRTYNDQRLASVDAYYVSGEQVTRKQGYASLHRIYGTGADAKRIVRQEYRDLNGELVNNSSGYAYLIRSYNSLGKVETERYFGTNNEPVEIGSGYYGYHRTYDEEGRITATTYLSADEKPINTKNGYAAIKNIYTSEDVKHLFFNADGMATTGTHGEYGYEMEDGRKMLLNSSGEPLQRLDIFLNSNPVAVLILGAVFILLALIMPGKARIAFLIFYLWFIVLMTLAWREGIDVVKGELFWSYKQFFSSAFLRREIINNVFLFIPLGVITVRLLGENRRAWAAVLICLVGSVVIELLQLKQNLGTFEFDDMISNGIGGMIGTMVARVAPSIKPSRR